VTKLLTFASHSKKFRNLSVQPGPRGSNDLRVGRKMATSQLFFQLGQAKDLSAPLYMISHVPLVTALSQDHLPIHSVSDYVFCR